MAGASETLSSGSWKLFKRVCEMLEIPPIVPQSDAAVPAPVPEEAPGTPEPLVQIARRLLHVLTIILVLLSVYTFYVSSPVLIPADAGGADHDASLAGRQLAGRAEDTPPSQRRRRNCDPGGNPRRRRLRFVRPPLSNGCRSCPKPAAKSMKCCAPSKSPSLKSNRRQNTCLLPRSGRTQALRKRFSWRRRV